MRYTLTFDAFLVAACLGLSAPASVWGIPFSRGHELPATHIDSREASHHSANVSPQVASPFTLPLTPIDDDLDMGYTALVKVGTNPTPYTVLMDCGSSEFWLVSETCPQRGRRVPIGFSTSQTFQSLGDKWKARYADGAVVTGSFATDDVAIDGRILSELPFGTGNTLKGTLTTDTYDGIMGFGFTESSKTGAPTILDALATTKKIPRAISGWKLSRNADGRNDGEIMFGGENDAVFFQDKQVVVQNLSGESNKNWKFNIDGISMDGFQIIPARVGIVDTGTSVLYVHPRDALAVNNEIPGVVELRDGTYAIPCVSQSKLSITINGRQFDIDPRDIVANPVSTKATTDICYSNIVPDPMRQPGEWLIGIPFLKNVYLTLDVTGNQIGFAKLR
ncbi:acid protease [Dentipellis sp. KUC8613]|nr:acid protease [Dentipellis sp. KUC8613]